MDIMGTSTRKAGFMDVNAKLDEDVIIAKTQALNLLLKCGDNVGSNPCNKAFLFYECFRE